MTSSRHEHLYDMKVFGIVGRKNSGKTHLVTRLVAQAAQRGLRVSTVKHAHHAFDVDQPGKDSYRHREAGAHEVLVASAQRWALLHELRGAPEPSLPVLLARLTPCDLVLVEGFKREVERRLEVYRACCGQSPLALEGAGIAAVATDDATTFAGSRQLHCLALDDTAAILDYVLARA
jgi:molybdopterin-guanine dinucleotide biosynthesis adapter protein